MSQNMSQPTSTPVYKLVVVRMHDKEYSVRVEGDMRKFAHEATLYLELVTNNPPHSPTVEFNNILIVEKGENNRLIVQKDNIRYEVIPAKRITLEEVDYYTDAYICQEKICFRAHENTTDQERDKLFNELANILVLARQLTVFAIKTGSGYELVNTLGRFRVW